MSSREQLDALPGSGPARRLQLVLLSQGAALLPAALLVGHGARGAVAARARCFPPTGVLASARALLVAALLAVAVFAWLRWRALQRNAGAAALERALPAQAGRIQTYLQERRAEPGEAPFLLDLLADDAARIAEREPLATAHYRRSGSRCPAPRRPLAFAALVALLVHRRRAGRWRAAPVAGQLPPASRHRRGGRRHRGAPGRCRRAPQPGPGHRGAGGRRRARRAGACAFGGRRLGSRADGSRTARAATRSRCSRCASPRATT